MLKNIEDLGLLEIPVNKNLLVEMPLPVKLVVVSEVVRHFHEDYDNAVKTIKTEDHLRWYMEVICQAFQLPRTEHKTIGKALEIYHRFIFGKENRPAPLIANFQVFVKDIFSHFSFLFHQPKKLTGVELTEYVKACNRVLTIFVEIGNKEAHLVNQKGWVYLMKTLLGITDSVCRVDGMRALSSGVVKVLFDFWICSLKTSSVLWEKFQEISRRWGENLDFVRQWNAMTKGLTLRIVNHLYGNQEGLNRIRVEWVNLNHIFFPDPEVGKKVTEMSLPVDFNYFLWHIFLYCLGNPNDIKNPNNFQHSMRGVRQVVRILCEVGKYPLMQKVVSKNLSLKYPPDGDSILKKCGDWMFQGLARGEEYDVGKSVIHETLLRLFIRKGGNGVMRKQLSLFYHFMMKGLKEYDPSSKSLIGGSIMNHSVEIFSIQTLPGVYMLIPFYLNCCENILFSKSASDKDLRLSCIRIMNSIIGIQNRFPKGVVGNGSDELGLHDIPKNVHFDVKSIKMQIQRILVKALTCESDELNFQNVLWGIGMVLFEEVDQDPDFQSSMFLKQIITIIRKHGSNPQSPPYTAKTFCCLFDLLSSISHLWSKMAKNDEETNCILDLLETIGDNLVSQLPVMKSNPMMFWKYSCKAFICLGDWLITASPLILGEHVVDRKKKVEPAPVEPTTSPSKKGKSPSKQRPVRSSEEGITKLATELLKGTVCGHRRKDVICAILRSIDVGFGMMKNNNQYVERVFRCCYNLMNVMVSVTGNFPGTDTQVCYDTTTYFEEKHLCDENPHMRTVGSSNYIKYYLFNRLFLFSVIEHPSTDGDNSHDGLTFISRSDFGKFVWDAKFMFPQKIAPPEGKALAEKTPAGHFTGSSSEGLVNLLEEEKANDVLMKHFLPLDFGGDEDKLGPVMRLVDDMEKIQSEVVKKHKDKVDKIDFAVREPENQTLYSTRNKFQLSRFFLSNLGFFNIGTSRETPFYEIMQSGELELLLKELDEIHVRETYKVSVLYVGPNEDLPSKHYLKDCRKKENNRGGPSKKFLAFVDSLSWKIDFTENFEERRRFLGEYFKHQPCAKPLIEEEMEVEVPKEGGKEGETEIQKQKVYREQPLDDLDELYYSPFVPYFANHRIEILYDVLSQFKSHIQRLSFLQNNLVNIIWSEHSRNFKKKTFEHVLFSPGEEGELSYNTARVENEPRHETQNPQINIIIYPLRSSLYRISIRTCPKRLEVETGPLCHGMIVNERLLVHLVSLTVINANQHIHRLKEPSGKAEYADPGEKRRKLIKKIAKKFQKGITHDNLLATILIQKLKDGKGKSSELAPKMIIGGRKRASSFGKKSRTGFDVPTGKVAPGVMRAAGGAGGRHEKARTYVPNRSDVSELVSKLRTGEMTVDRNSNADVTETEDVPTEEEKPTSKPFVPGGGGKPVSKPFVPGGRGKPTSKPFVPRGRGRGRMRGRRMRGRRPRRMRGRGRGGPPMRGS